MRTSNPVLSEKIFSQLEAADDRMTLQGTINKSLCLIFLVVGAAYFSWQGAVKGEGIFLMPKSMLYLLIATFILSLIIVFKKTTAPYLAPVYAIMEGVLLGVISFSFEKIYPGIVVQALLCTFGTFFSLLMAYRLKLVEPTENFKQVIMAATAGIALVYFMDIVLNMFGHKVPFIHETGPMGIVVSVIVTCVAALNLVLDFDCIEEGVKRGAPRYMEWYSSFALLVTLIWLYLEILRLLAKAKRR